jgi:peptidoglycan/LPS O-acetylase OafA/YrhL
MNWRLAEGVLTNSAKILPPNPALSIYWSLSLEEQFYLALPFIVLLTRHHLAKVLLVAVAVMFFVPKGVGSPAWFFRLDPIIWGVLMAFWRQHPSYTLLEPRFLARGKLRRVALTLAVPLLAAAVMGLNVVFFANSLVALICAALVYAGSFGKDYLFPEGRVRSILLWIGSRSYAIYLCHVLLFQLTVEIWYRLSPPGTVFDGTYTLRYAATAVVLICIAAEFNYRLVERPLRALGRRNATAIEATSSPPLATSG